MKKTLLLGLGLWPCHDHRRLRQDPIKIVYIGKNTGNPYFDSITGGFVDACSRHGLRV